MAFLLTSSATAESDYVVVVFDLTVEEGEGALNPFGDGERGKHRRRTVGVLGSERSNSRVDVRPS